MAVSGVLLILHHITFSQMNRTWCVQAKEIQDPFKEQYAFRLPGKIKNSKPKLNLWWTLLAEENRLDFFCLQLWFVLIYWWCYSWDCVGFIFLVIRIWVLPILYTIFLLVYYIMSLYNDLQNHAVQSVQLYAMLIVSATATADRFLITTTSIFPYLWSANIFKREMLQKREVNTELLVCKRILWLIFY